MDRRGPNGLLEYPYGALEISFAGAIFEPEVGKMIGILSETNEMRLDIAGPALHLGPYLPKPAPIFRIGRGSCCIMRFQVWDARGIAARTETSQYSQLDVAINEMAYEDPRPEAGRLRR